MDTDTHSESCALCVHGHSSHGYLGVFILCSCPLNITTEVIENPTEGKCRQFVRTKLRRIDAMPGIDVTS